MPTAKVIKRNCELCGTEFYTRQSDINRGWGRFCSRNCNASYGNTVRSDGTSRSNTRKIAREIYIKRNGMPHCNHCGASPADVHHLNEDVLDNSAENLIALCRSCHIAYHNHVSPKRKKAVNE